MTSPRVQVSLDKELYDIVNVIAKGTNQSASGFIASMLAEQREVLSQIASAVEKARRLSGPLSGGLTVSLANKQFSALADLHHAQSLLDRLCDDLDDEFQNQSETRTRDAKRASGSACDPLMINKGVCNKGVKRK